MRFVGIVVLALALWAGYNSFALRERIQPHGQVAPEAPYQRNIDGAQPFQFKDFTLTPRAKFALTARVLARERYRADRGAALSPIDIAFGWGPMSDTSLIDMLMISQSGRFYFWRYKSDLPVAHDVIIRSSANMHLIPADSKVRETLFRARVGDVLELSGELVDATQNQTWRWNTSLSRDDSGGGACELIYVTSVAIKK